MKKVTEGHIIQPTPLDTMFSMKELHGTLSQKYDAINGLYIADRTLTPFVLKPEFSVNDKTGKIPNGDYTAQLINCVWTVKCKVKGNAPVAGKDYVVNEETKELTLKCNLDPDTSGEISFSAEFIDSRRGDVLKSFWRGELSCVSEVQWRVSLRTEWPQRTNLIPWKNRGVFAIPVQLMNGDKNQPDGSCVYKWQVFENEKWREIDYDTDLWYREGKDTKIISVEQKYIQSVTLRCMAWPKDNTSELQVVPFLLKRYYGNYEDDINIVEGAYIFPETGRAVAEASVITRNGGHIANAEQYFDIEILYSRNDGQWWHVAHGTRGEVTRSMFPIDSTMTHSFAEQTRELTAEIPITVDGSYLLIDGQILTGQFPIIDRNL